MFTGIIEDLGRIEKLSRSSQGSRIAIRSSKITEDAGIGDSVAVNGVCLTIAQLENDTFFTDVMPETLAKTNLGQMKNGDLVNLERALKASDRLGGHFVLGHVDEVGTIMHKRKEGNSIVLKISATRSISDYLVPKGSIAIDGISLTITDVENQWFMVAVIPHTAKATTLGQKTVGSTVNLEVDIIGKYVKRMMDKKTSSRSTLDLLYEHGYLDQGGVK